MTRVPNEAELASSMIFLFPCFSLTQFSVLPPKRQKIGGNGTWVREKDLFSKIKSAKTHKEERKRNLRLLVEMLTDAGGKALEGEKEAFVRDGDENKD
jgi:hypothetical protein